MTTVHYDSLHSDEVRRRNLFDGDIYVYSPTPTSVQLCEFVKELLAENFGDLDPELAQYHMPVQAYAELLGVLKPQFIHHPRSKAYLQAVIRARGCDAGTYFEVPKLRSSTSDDYLTSGIAYAWHPHRDTWYSAPRCQINWWMPVFQISSDNCMAFHPNHWNRAVANTSAGYNYYEWNRKYRGPSVARMTDGDPRPLPRATETLEIEPDIRIVCTPGSLIMFSAAQLHSSVPNTSGRTRFSVDFRTVHRNDLSSNAGATNVDSACTGTALHEFLSASEFSPLEPELIARYEDGTETLGPKTFGA